MTKKTKHRKLCYQLNDSLFHSFHCILTDGVSFENSINQCYDVINTNETIHSNIQSQEDVSLFGMICDRIDVIAKNILMPNDMEVGDWVCMSGMGAYTNSAKSEFNGMKSVTKVYKYRVRFIIYLYKYISILIYILFSKGSKKKMFLQQCYDIFLMIQIFEQQFAKITDLQINRLDSSSQLNASKSPNYEVLKINQLLLAYKSLIIQPTLIF